MFTALWETLSTLSGTSIARSGVIESQAERLDVDVTSQSLHMLESLMRDGGAHRMRSLPGVTS